MSEVIKPNESLEIGTKVRVISSGKEGSIIYRVLNRNEYQVGFESGYNETQDPYSEWFKRSELQTIK